MNSNVDVAWFEQAAEQLEEKNAKLEQDFRLGHWPRYDYDLTVGTLRFSDEAKIKVVAGIQIAGSTSAKAGNWLWSWANSNLPSTLLEDAERVRSFGEANDTTDLMQPYVLDANHDLEALGWKMTAAAVRICNAIGAYRSPRTDGGALYLILRNVSWAN